MRGPRVVDRLVREHHVPSAERGPVRRHRPGHRRARLVSRADQGARPSRSRLRHRIRGGGGDEHGQSGHARTAARVLHRVAVPRPHGLLRAAGGRHHAPARPGLLPAVVAGGRLVLCLAQVVQQGMAVWPGYQNIVQSAGRMQHYRYQHRPAGIGSVITQRAASYGSRLYVSEEVRQRLRGLLSGVGLHFITDLAFLGVNPVNATFKGVSMDRLYPSSRLMLGLIGGQQAVIGDDVLLDVLGVNLVMMAADDGPVPSSLRLTDRLTYAGSARTTFCCSPMRTLGRKPYCLTAPRKPWPCRSATAVAIAARSAGTTRRLWRLGCPSRYVCASADGPYTARFAPSDHERLLFLSVLYRPEWSAAAPTGSAARPAHRRRIRQRDRASWRGTKSIFGSCPASASRSRGSAVVS